jgi:branched-chain amino acid transport system permease protein
LSPSKMQRFIFGALLILFALYRPQGLLPAKNPVFNESQLKKGKGSELKGTTVPPQKENMQA